MQQEQIILKKVCVHNLKSVDLTLDKNKLIVFTGVSGSGKSSMAFDTIYVEGQRRYVESLSAFARNQIGQLSKPDLESASGLSPTISIEQKTAGRNPRSTVGTVTEIYDYLRVLYARVGIPHCPVSGEPVRPQSRDRIISIIQRGPKRKVMILAPYARNKKAEFKEDFQDLLRKGFMRARVDGNIVNLSDEMILDGSVSHDVDVVIDRLSVDDENLSRIADSITQALQFGQGICIVLDADTLEEELYSMHAYSPKSGLSYSSLEPTEFSFNSPTGMCPRCHGMGTIYEFNLDLIIDPELSIAEDCCKVASSYNTVRYGNIYDNLAAMYGFSVKTPWKKLPEKAKKVFLFGTEKKWTRMHFVHPITRATWTDLVQWRGVLHDAHSRFAEAKSESYRNKMQKQMSIQTCPECHGSRLKPYPAATLLGGKKIFELAAMTIAECHEFFSNIKFSEQEQFIADEVLKEILQRLQFLIEVGLHYLTLDRTAPTLSGGEAQRVRLASQIGGGLVGITYILDEPSIGLHPRDDRKLIDTLKHLRDRGNTVIVVEHDEETIWAADHVVEFGPGAGIRGGEIVVDGDLKTLMKSKHSLTAGYLTGRLTIDIPNKRRKAKKIFLEIVGATHHNLKNIDVKIPLGLFIAVTGVSGSGKSSLITDILYPALSNYLHAGDHLVGAHKTIKGIDNLDKVIAIDQSPIGRNPRSNPATYIKLFDDIRNLFVQLPESLARGYKPGRFSFNVKEGSCTQCGGMGMVKIDMDFMEDAWVDCSLCKSKRFDAETLSVHYKNKSIYDVLEMTVDEALEFFSAIPHIKHKLELLQKVGLGYLKLGQSSTTLSGGEAQRIKLAKELVRPATGKTLYLLDEPTTGLHFHDIKHLLEVLHTLVDNGNTVLVIEHNMDLVKTADWIIDLGPEGGNGGGEVVATGTPEQIAKLATPTGEAIHYALYPNREARLEKLFEKGKGRKKSETKPSIITHITVEGAEQNNLKHLNVEIPREKITICTGPSGSGKSSFAFETIYAEGQRRFIESLSPYARQFVKQMPKPKVGRVEGLSPAIAIEQKAHAGNPRSTVGTLTEVYDYLRILYARLGIAHCPETGEVIRAISKEHVVDRIMAYTPGDKIQVLAPIEFSKTDKFDDVLARLRQQGYLRIRLNGEYYHLETDNPAFDKKKKNELFLVIDRLKVDPSMKTRLFEAVENATDIGRGQMLVVREEEDIPFNLSFAVESTGKSYPEITPKTFAFNTSEGMCHDCLGLGCQYGANLMQSDETGRRTITALLKDWWGDRYNYQAMALAKQFFKSEKIDPDIPFYMLSIEKRQLFMNGAGEDKWLFNEAGFRYRWLGVNNVFGKLGKSAHAGVKDAIVPLLNEQTCPSCEGARLNPLARHVTIHGKGIHDLCCMPMDKALEFVESLRMNKQDKKLLDEVVEQLVSRLRFLCDVGLQYLALERRAPSLSGGEAQRIRLARQLGSGLTGVLYVLDEPTIGLHPRDNERLNNALKQLKELGNTLILVEHDPLTIQTADYLLDFGPASGEHGGHIVAKGTLKQIENNPKSQTGAYLSGRKKISIPKKRRPHRKGSVYLRHVTKNNLKNISVEFPVGVMSCLTGVSGSGKSTLLQQVLLPAIQKRLFAEGAVEVDGAEIEGLSHFDKVISITQDPIGHTVRSDVGTYSDVITRLRELFASLPAALMKGLQPKHFSYNHLSGMCRGCWGLGYRRVEMHFLPPVRVECEECHGMRLNATSREIMYGGKTFGEYLNMTVDEARRIFENHPRIVRALDTLISVGLGYLKLGQESASLSGGEAQRLKLSRELAKRSTGKTLYLLDEPTTGLHSLDVEKLLKVLHQLVDNGNTMIIIEHNLDVIRNADYIIDLGPEAGEGGGKVVCSGTPEEVMKCKGSWTGKFLAS